MSDALTPEMARELAVESAIHNLCDGFELYEADDINIAVSYAATIRQELSRSRARLAEVTAQRDSLVPLAKFALLMTGGSSAFVEENDAADAALTDIAAERGKEAK